MKHNYHHRFFLHGLRTSILFISGLLVYEILKSIENKWNKNHPGNELSNFAKRKSLHFVSVFIIDVLFLYSVAFLLNIYL
jgi:hypothetical protein